MRGQERRDDSWVRFILLNDNGTEVSYFGQVLYYLVFTPKVRDEAWYHGARANDPRPQTEYLLAYVQSYKIIHLHDVDLIVKAQPWARELIDLRNIQELVGTVKTRRSEFFVRQITCFWSRKNLAISRRESNDEFLDRTRTLQANVDNAERADPSYRGRDGRGRGRGGRGRGRGNASRGSQAESEGSATGGRTVTRSQSAHAQTGPAAAMPNRGDHGRRGRGRGKGRSGGGSGSRTPEVPRAGIPPQVTEGQTGTPDHGGRGGRRGRRRGGRSNTGNSGNSAPEIVIPEIVDTEVAQPETTTPSRGGRRRRGRRSKSETPTSDAAEEPQQDVAGEPQNVPMQVGMGAETPHTVPAGPTGAGPTDATTTGGAGRGGRGGAAGRTHIRKAGWSGFGGRAQDQATGGGGTAAGGNAAPAPDGNGRGNVGRPKGRSAEGRGQG